NIKMQYLSIAQQQLVEIAKAISMQSKVLIMDEPTSALSPTEIKYLFKVIEKIKKQNVGIIYISHKLDEIFSIADRITVFRDGTKITTENAGKLNNEDLINMMVGRKLDDVFPPKERKSGKRVLTVDNLSSDKVHSLSFYIREGEIVGFSGLMGAGRTEMTKALVGIDKRTSGKVLIFDKPLPKNDPISARKMGIGLVSENRKELGILPNLSVEKNVSVVSLDQVSHGPVINRSKERISTNAIVEELSIKTPSLTQLITKLSGGNQQKVMLARWLIKQNLKLLIIDEPTRGIDVGSKAEVYELMHQLAKKGLSILMVSSELSEVLGMCDRIYVMKEGKITGEFNAEDADEVTLLSKAIN
ncbi:MAG: sugar ABC transporter ATP-binding protein, partial [Christensenellales bacterium]